MNSTDLIILLDPWLDRRCQRLSARLPGLDADEVYQRVIVEFLEKLERWLQQDATVAVVAQAKTLLSFCLKHVETQEIRERRRRHEVDEAEDGEALARLAKPVKPVDETSAAELLAQVRGSTSPPCALCLLSLRLPAVVARDDAAQAKAWRKGGSNAVPRELDDAWSIYVAARDRPSLVANDLLWKDHVGIAWYTEGAAESVGEAQRRAAAAKVERYANRGAEDLRRALLDETVRQAGAQASDERRRPHE
ncbi:MAG: hypothetical protein IPN01_37840 [Deltaproteobacteria bacterium]|nr:hypothetical protein [Deltaproteobacteria bacterium]